MCPDCGRLAAIMDERDRRYALHFDLHQRAAALAMEDAMRWREAANEWRQSMNDREANFLSRGMGFVIGALSVVATLISIFLHK